MKPATAGPVIIALATGHGHIDAGCHGAVSVYERQTFLLAAVDLPAELQPEQFAEVLMGFLLLNP